MTIRGLVIFAVALLFGFLTLRPVIGRLGEPEAPEIRGRSTIDSSQVSGTEAQAGAPAWAEPAGVSALSTTPVTGIVHPEAVERQVLELTNRQRQANGLLPALQAEETLRKIARGHSDDMLQRGFFDHENPDGESPADRVARQHRRLIGISGENIWECSNCSQPPYTDLAEIIVDGWMNSHDHRRNILKPEFTHLGVGISIAGHQVKATQCFAGVRTWLKEALPLQVRGGQRLDLATAAASEMFDLWSSQRGIKVAGSFPVSEARIPATPGTFKLRFYFRESDTGFTIYNGPQIEVR